MTAAYLSMDRYDIQHAAKELATEMKTPTNEGIVRLKRLARYLNGAPRLVQKFKRQSEHRWVSDRLPSMRIGVRLVIIVLSQPFGPSVVSCVKRSTRHNCFPW